ncbi:MAG: nitroreductase family protein [Desulfovibrio sp.]|nr:nitroreductase family protein [Desulfovibrio sp.]
MDFLAFVKKARTCRRFAEDKPLQREDLDFLVECARHTPSARNAQQVRFVEVFSECAAKLFPLTHWAMALKDWQGPYVGERPTAFLGLALPEAAGELALVDLGIVAQTIQLAATSRGFGCCIIKSFDQAKAEQLLELPEALRLQLVLGLGVAVEKRVSVDVPASGSLAYYRDDEGVHYVPKRSLEELVIRRFD